MFLWWVYPIGAIAVLFILSLLAKSPQDADGRTYRDKGGIDFPEYDVLYEYLGHELDFRQIDIVMMGRQLGNVRTRQILLSRPRTPYKSWSEPYCMEFPILPQIGTHFEDEVQAILKRRKEDGWAVERIRDHVDTLC